MSQNATEGQEPNGANGDQGQEPNATGTQGQEPGDQQNTGADNGGQIDVEKIEDPALRAFVISQQKAAEEARRDAAKHRTRANALETEKTEFERLSETADQTAQRERAEADAERERLRQEVRELKVGAKVRSAAEAAKAFDPDVVMVMIGDKVTLNDNGDPTNVPELLAELRTDKPFLFKRTTTNAGDGNDEPGGGDAKSDMNAGIRRAAGRA